MHKINKATHNYYVNIIFKQDQNNNIYLNKYMKHYIQTANKVITKNIHEITKVTNNQHESNSNKLLQF